MSTPLNSRLTTVGTPKPSPPKLAVAATSQLFAAMLPNTAVASSDVACTARSRGWFSTNILGNRDGQALDDPASLASKLGTKGDVLSQMLNYEVRNHIVQISYYPPRGDAKEAWDNIDVVGFLGERMQIKVNFLCKDSILAAPLVIEIARCLDLARRRGECGPVEALGSFFKAPMAADGRPEHAFFAQQTRLMGWLAGSGRHAVNTSGTPADTLTLVP